jgi:hypothetical protein
MLNECLPPQLIPHKQGIEYTIQILANKALDLLESALEYIILQTNNRSALLDERRLAQESNILLDALLNRSQDLTITFDAFDLLASLWGDLVEVLLDRSIVEMRHAAVGVMHDNDCTWIANSPFEMSVKVFDRCNSGRTENTQSTLNIESTSTRVSDHDGTYDCPQRGEHVGRQSRSNSRIS